MATVMVPQESVVVVRDGKRKALPLGVPFAFTQKEIDHIRENRPEALRTPINEGGVSLDTQSNIRTAAGRVLEGGNDTSREFEGGENGTQTGTEGGQSDAEIEAANEEAAERKTAEALEKAGEKLIAGTGAAGKKAVAAKKAAAAPAVEKIDDL